MELPHERYDKQEDRYNDIKRHDNPNHPSMHCHEKRLAAAEHEMQTYIAGVIEQDEEGIITYDDALQQYYANREP